MTVSEIISNMTTSEIISNLVAFLALAVSGVSYSKGAKMASASIEISLGARITTTKEKVSDIGSLMIPFISKTKSSRTIEEKRTIEGYDRLLDLAIENNLNAYEEACAKYIDKKIDKIRFKKTYKSDIKKLVERSDLKQYFDGVTSEYKAILKLYDEWENLEK